MKKRSMKIEEVKLNTLHMYENIDARDCDYELWRKIAEFMNGETALVIRSSAIDGQYVFLGLTDAEKDKELLYMMEQDSLTGVFIDDREGFDKAWDSEEYEHDVCFYLEPQYLIFEESEGAEHEKNK